MTQSPAHRSVPDARPRGRRTRSGRGGPSIRPSQVLVVVAVLAVFVTGLVVGGGVGALLVGGLSVGAGVLLVLRWAALDGRIRMFRAMIVLIGLAVALSLLTR